MSIVIQSVLFNKKLFNRTKSKKWLNYHGLKIIKCHETLNYLRYRQQVPNQGWIYRNILILKGIYFVGMIKPSKKQIKGGFSLSVSVPKNIEDTLNQYGDQLVKSAAVCREPLSKALHTLLNVVTLGKARKAMEEKNYDKYFHLYLLVTLESGTTLKVEKNENLKITPASPPNYSTTQCMPVPKADNSNRSFGEMFDRMVNSYPFDFIFKYDVAKANCQRFVTAFLQSNGLDYPRLRVFVNQNVEAAMKDPFVRKIIGWATDTKRSINKIIEKIF